MKLSFVIPCYRSEKTIKTVVDEIVETMNKRPDFDYEIIMVNDGSPDNVWEVIQRISEENSKAIGINLSKNFGQHSALLAGYYFTDGDYVVSLDDDGQTPACDVFKLYEEIEKGFDIVYATYPEVKQNWFRRLGSNFAKKMSDYMFDIKNDIKASSYFIAKRYIIEEMIKYKNPYPYMVGLVLRVTRSFSVVPIEQRKRMVGKSGYNIRSLIKLWVNGFTAFSVKPLEIGIYLGFISAFIGIVFAIVTVIRKLFITPDMAAGWSSTISVILVLGGVILFMLGLIGEYVGRIYICINDSPQYVVKEIIGKPEKSDKRSELKYD